MEKVTYDIVFNLKNNPSGLLREINKLVIDIQGSTQKMTSLMSQRMSLMQNPIDEARNNWLKLSGDAGAYFAVLSENTAGLVSLIEIKKALDEIGGVTKVISTVQNTYNKTVLLGQKAINAYQIQVLTARTAISTTTGATKALNIALAASPWILGATLIAGAAVAIYKFCSGSNDAAKAQGRLNDIMTTMNKEVATERLALDNLFTPLNKAREGTEEWQKAKDDIVAKYGDYLEKMGIEITNADTARIAYDKLSEAILNTARSRAMEKATSGAGEVYAESETNALKDIRNHLNKGIGEGAGKITADQADYLCFVCFSSFLRRFSSSFWCFFSAFIRAKFSRICFSFSCFCCSLSWLLSIETSNFCSNSLCLGVSFWEMSFLDNIPPILHAPMAPSMRQISII